MLEWVMAAIPVAWIAAGDIPDTVNKWQPYVDLMQIPWEMGNHQTMFNLNSHGPDDECFMTGLRDLLL